MGTDTEDRFFWYNTLVSKKHTVITVALVLAASAAQAEKQPFSRYQTIVDRQMFGELPAGFDPTKMPSEVARSSAKQGQELTKEQEKLQSSIHFSAINVTPDGATAVGFTDNSNPKAPVHYYLKEGETRDGWKVVEADPKAATMTIAKGDIEVSLSLGGNSGKGAGQTKSRTGGNEPAAGGSGSPMLKTLRGRRAQREQREAAERERLRAEQEAKDAEREEQAEKDKAQREAEREETRSQMRTLMEELRRVREEKARQQPQQADDDANNDPE